MEQSFEAVGVVERPQPGDVSLHGETPLVVRLSLDFLGIDFDRLTLFPDQVHISPMPEPGDKVVVVSNQFSFEDGLEREAKIIGRFDERLS